MKRCFHANVVTKESVLADSFVTVENGMILSVSSVKPEDADVTDYAGCYIFPGFIDIHCHAGNDKTTTEDPAYVGKYHLAHGTTSMLLTYYRDVPHDTLMDCLGKIKTLLGNSNIIGAHLEGPYLNANFGTGKGKPQPVPEKERYEQYIASGVVKQWTSSPEVPGVVEMIREIARRGIVPAIGHSQASYDDVVAADKAGARIVTHIFDATGTTKDPATMSGTEDISFDEACMLMDDMFYEVICDRNWVHVKKEKLALLVKTVGIDRVIAITDSFKNDGDETTDINVFYHDGHASLSGSKLTMDCVAKNLFRAGYAPVEIAKMTARNAARALNLDDRGEIAPGKRADLVLLDADMKLVKVL